MFSTIQKWHPLWWNFSFGNKKKSHGLRSGEYGGCGTKFLAKNSITEIAMWQGALSWWSIQLSAMSNSSVKIWWTVVWFKFNSLAIIRTVSQRLTAQGLALSPHCYQFLKLNVFQSGIHLYGFTALWKCLIPLERLWSRQSMLPIRLFQFIESFNAGFPKFGTKLDCTSLLEIALFHFRDTHTILLHKERH